MLSEKRQIVAGNEEAQEARSILERGQAAALMAVVRRWSGRFSEDDDLVERVLSQSAEDVAPTVPFAATVQRAAPDAAFRAVA